MKFKVIHNITKYEFFFEVPDLSDIRAVDGDEEKKLFQIQLINKKLCEFVSKMGTEFEVKEVPKKISVGIMFGNKEFKDNPEYKKL